MQNAAVNIDDHGKLFSEAQRVLRPRGRIALQEILAGPIRPILYPTPWARDEKESFVCPASEFRAVLGAAGMQEIAWVDFTAEYQQATRDRGASEKLPETLPPLGVHVLYDEEDFRSWYPRLVRNIYEDRLQFVRAIYEKDRRS